MNSFFVENPIIFWIILIGFISFRTLLPIRCKYDFKKIAIRDTERSEWKSLRDQNMVLASFTIVAIAIILSLPSGFSEDKKPSVWYLSLALFSFIIGSYVFRFTTDRRIPYVGETLEFEGLLALGIGLLYLASSIFKDIMFDLIYSVFFIGVFVVALIDLYLNYSWFYPKVESNG